MRASTLTSCFLLALALSASSAAFAGLGGTPSTFASSTAVQARRMAATMAAGSGAAAYSVQETTLEGGTLVREYIDGRGQVFAVSWNGPFLPDLRTLLGSHFGAFAARGQAGRQHGRGPVRVDQQDLVIESGGHMRAWNGRAWLRSALPAGVDAEVVE